jgi:hypothetical protein
MPVIAYAGFMLWIGNRNNKRQRRMAVLLSNRRLTFYLALAVCGASLTEPQFGTIYGQHWRLAPAAVCRHRTASFLSVIFSANNQRHCLLLTKIGSCLVIFGVLALYPTDDYDIRLTFARNAVIGGLARRTRF